MRTQITGQYVGDGSILRADLNTNVSGSAVITKILSGSTSRINLSSTGVDSGTGDVTVDLGITGFADGTYTKVTTDIYGRVIGSALLAALPATGSKYSILQGRYLIISLNNNNNRLYRLDFVKSEMDPFASWFYTQGTAILGDTMFDVSFVDGDVTLTWINQLLNTSSIMTRMLVI